MKTVASFFIFVMCIVNCSMSIYYVSYIILLIIQFCLIDEMSFKNEKSIEFSDSLSCVRLFL